MLASLKLLQKSINREPIQYVVQESNLVPQYVLIIFNNDQGKRYDTEEFIELKHALERVQTLRSNKNLNQDYYILYMRKGKFLKFTDKI
jgi:hypothetical protein